MSIEEDFVGDATEASRRNLFTRAGRVAAALAVAASFPKSQASALPSGAKSSGDDGKIPGGIVDERLDAAFRLRLREAQTDLLVGPAKNISNGDETLYPDKGGTFTKGLPHDASGRVDPAAYATLKAALGCGQSSDFEKIIMGGTRTLNGPQGGLAFDLAALDNVQFGQPEVPPAPSIASDQSGTELLEQYWASLLRDIPFPEYPGNTLAREAAAELSTLPTYLGPRNGSGQVTPELLFRGTFPGETEGPYTSQLMIRPTTFGAQPISQQLLSHMPGVDYMTTFEDWLTVQNGGTTGLQNQLDPVLRHIRNGRDLAAYTHFDVLFGAYLTAALVLSTLRVPLNPGNPYNGSTRQNGFGTFGTPDLTATLAEVANKALNAVWYQKWFVHMRTRPESAGGLVHLIKTGRGHETDVPISGALLRSLGLRRSYERNGSWLLSQAFPEGSPMHPAYPTGHGAIGGACITLLKFFFDGRFEFPDLTEPAHDGLSLLPYTQSDGVRLTVNGELNKLGHNVSFGHGIHSGIHWRSDSTSSLLLGEAVALSFLRNKANTYNETFTVAITKFDGSTATISNHDR